MRRIVIAGTHSGSGKTTVALALMQALKNRGEIVAPFKAGPDYIDPGFHRFVCERVSHNLDVHLMGDKAIAQTLTLGMNGADIGVIEGVMGYYDGISTDFTGSTYDLARRIKTPVLLVVDAAGSATSAAAEVLGFQKLREPSGVAGVIVNRASSERHYELVREAVGRYTSLPCIGWLKKDGNLHLSSRHLGLVPADETQPLRSQIDLAARLLTIDWPAFEEVVSGLPDVHSEPIPIVSDMKGYRLGIARDEAFSFYYEANFELMRSSGMKLIPFSPLHDARLPEGIDGLYMGGGFPEVFAEKLSANSSMRHSVRTALERGMRCYAECGGLMYLSQSIDDCEMVGYFPARCKMTDRLQRFGYVFVRDRYGREYPAHEFHHSTAEPEEDITMEFSVRKAASPEKNWRCGYQKGNTLAGYPHLHFLAHPELIYSLWKEVRV